MPRSFAQRNKTYRWGTPSGPSTVAGAAGRSTTHIATDTEAVEQRGRAQGAAVDALAAYGPQLGPSVGRIGDIAESGGSNPLQGVASILEFLDRGRRAVQLGIRDLGGFDSNLGKEINAGDYWQVLKGDIEGLKEDLGVELVGERGDLSSSNLFDLMGWEKTDNVWNRVGRGIAAFGGDVLTDPLSYVTGGGAARGTTASLQAARATVGDAARVSVERVIREGIEGGVRRATDDIGSAVGRRVASQVDDGAEIALQRQLREGILDKAPLLHDKRVLEATADGQRLTQAELDGIFERAVKDAAGIADDGSVVGGVAGEYIQNRLAKPIAERKFNQLPTEYVDAVFAKHEGKRLGDAFTTGGLRLGVPFSDKWVTRPIRGTAGLFNRVGVSKVTGKLKNSEAVQSFMQKIDANYPIHQIARRGAESPIGATDVMWAIAQKRRAASMFLNAGERAEVARAATVLDRVLKDANLDKAAVNEIHQMVYVGGQLGVAPTDVARKYGDEVAQAVSDYAAATHAHVGRIRDVVEEISPNSVGFIDTHIPLMFGDDFAKVVRYLETQSSAFAYDMKGNPAAAERLLAKLGVSEEEMNLFMEAMTGLGSKFKPRKGKAMTGSRAPARRRTMGRTLVAPDIAPEGSQLLFFNPRQFDSAASAAAEGGGGVATEVRRGWTSQAEISEALGKVASAVQEHFDIPVKVKDLSQGLETDMGKVMSGYMSSMQAMAEELAFHDALKTIGAVGSVKTAVSTEQVLAAISSTGIRQTVEGLLSEGRANLDELSRKPVKTKTYNVGGGTVIDVPVEALEHPQVKRVLTEWEALNKSAPQMARQQKQLRDRAVETYMKDYRMSRKTAEVIVDATVGDAPKLRAEMEVALNQMTSELEDAIILSHFVAARDGIEAAEALEMARSYAAHVRKKTRDEFNRHTAVFDSIEWPKADVNLTPDFDMADPVKAGQTIDVLLAPVDERLTQMRADSLVELQNLLEEKSTQYVELASSLKDEGVRVASRRVADTGAGELMLSRTKKEQQMRFLEREINALSDLLDAVDAAKSGDELISTAQVATAAAHLDASEAGRVAGLWDRLVRQGFAYWSRKGTEPKNLMALEAQWNNFIDAARSGAGSLEDEVFGSPYFWRNIAYGQLEEASMGARNADAVRANLVADGYTAADIEDVMSMLGVAGKPDILGGVEQRAEDMVRRIERLWEESAVSGVKLSKLAEMWELSRGDRTADAFLGASRKDQEKAVMELLAPRQAHLDALRAGDEGALVESIAAEMRAELSGTRMNLDAKIGRIGGTQDFGPALESLRRAPYDPHAARRAVALNNQINEAISAVYPNHRLDLHITRDGEFAMRFIREDVEQRPPFNFREMVDAFEEGKMTERALRDHGLGVVVDAAQTRKPLRAAQREAARARYNAVPRMDAARHTIEQMEDVYSLVGRVLSGESDARALRAYAYSGTPTHGLVYSDAWSSLRRRLPANERDRWQRYIDEALLFAESEKMPASARRYMREASESHWDEKLYRPLAEVKEQYEALSRDVVAASAEATSKEHEEFLGLMHNFLSDIAALEDLARPVSEDGLASAGVRLTSRTTTLGGETVDEVAKRARGALKRLTAPPNEALGLSKADYKAFAVRLSDAGKIDMKQAYLVPTDNFNLGGLMEGKLIDPAVGAIYRNMVESHYSLFTEQGISEVHKSMNEAMRWWRGGATVARLPFHVRNMISAVSNGFLIGVGATHYAAVGADLVRYRKALAAGEDAIAAVSRGNRSMFQAAVEEGVISNNMVREQLGLRSSALAKSQLTKLNPLSSDFVAISGGASVMQKMEDHVRLAAFRRWYDEAIPESASVAREMTMVAHFDYQDLAVWETKLKTFMPFFTWTRRNVPLQLKAVLEQPRYIQAFGHAQNALQDNFGYGDDNPYGKYASSLASPLGIWDGDSESETWARWIIDPDLPIGNLDDLPLFKREGDSLLPVGSEALSIGSWSSWLLGNLGPQYSLPADAAYSEEYAVNAPFGWSSLLQLGNMIDFAGVIPDPTADGNVEVSNTTKTLMSTALPWLNDYTKGFSTSNTTRASLGQDEESGWLEKFLDTAFSAGAGGFGLTHQTPTDMRSRAFDDEKFIQDEVRKARARIPAGAVAAASGKLGPIPVAR